MRVIKTITDLICYCCDGSGKIYDKKWIKCPTCKGTGIFKESQYFHIFKGQDGKEYCIDGETLK